MREGSRVPTDAEPTSLEGSKWALSVTSLRAGLERNGRA